MSRSTKNIDTNNTRPFMIELIKEIEELIPKSVISEMEMYRCATDLFICKNRLNGTNKKTNNPRNMAIRG